MKRVAEIIHLVPEERDSYLQKYLNPSDKTAQTLWNCGIRKQFYYEFGGDILRTYEYTGKCFQIDMEILSKTEETKDFFLKKRRRDVPEENRNTTNWWAPLKWEGAVLMDEPPCEESEQSFREQYHSMMSGKMEEDEELSQFDYDEDDWSESIHM